MVACSQPAPRYEFNNNMLGPYTVIHYVLYISCGCCMSYYIIVPQKCVRPIYNLTLCAGCIVWLLYVLLNFQFQVFWDVMHGA